MSINIGVLEQKNIRATISVIVDNKEHEVIIKNAFGEEREKLLKLWESKSKEGTKEAVLELTKEILLRLTNLEISDLEQLENIISNPREEMSLIIHEVNEIVNEIVVQYWTSQIRQINQSTVNLLTTKALQKTEVLNRIVSEIENAKTPVSELEKNITDLPIVKNKKRKRVVKNG